MSNIRVTRTCENCGKQFEAKTTVTRFCSTACYQSYLRKQKRYAALSEAAKIAEKRLSKKRGKKETILSARLAELSQKSYLTIAETAELLGYCKQTIYNLAKAGEILVVQLSSRWTLVPRAEIERMFEGRAGHYKARPKPSDLSLESLYSLREITTMYDVTESAVHEAAKRKKILKVSSNGKIYFDKKGIDVYFSERNSSDTDTRWYSVAEACKKFGCSPSSINTYCLRNKIPHRKEKGRVFYHASSLDKAKGIDCRDTYYAGAEAANKYGYDRQTLYRIIHKNNIPYKMIGRCLYVEKIPLDAFMKSIRKIERTDSD